MRQDHVTEKYHQQQMADLHAGLALDGTRLREAAHALAMLALQSERYREDPDYRDAVDDLLASISPDWRAKPNYDPEGGTDG